MKRNCWIIGCLAGCALLGLACLGCGGLGAGAAVWLKRQDTPYPTDPAALTQVVQEQVAHMRGLKFTRPVTLKTLTPDELRQRIQQDFQKEWSPKEARDYALTLAAFDLLDPNTDLYQLFLDLYSEQVAGLYDPETKELYIVSGADRLGVLALLTLAHELTHALQDQHYDLQALGYGEQEKTEHDSEYLAGVRGLVEGDASLLESHYLSQLSPLDILRLIKEYTQVNLDQFQQAPEAISAGLAFPYRQGRAFVQDLYESGGWAAVNEAYARPPQSTEQILHPQRYHSGDAPRLVALPPLTDTLGGGWQLADEDILGEFYARLHLSGHLKSDAAASAAEGWGGDRYAVYHDDAQAGLLLVWRTLWDSPTEAGEFVKQYETYLSQAADHKADLAQAGRSCWQLAGDYRCLVWEAAAATVVRGPDAATVERVLETLSKNN